MHWLKDKLIHKFGYAFAGLWTGIRQDSSIALQCVLGAVTIIVCLFLPLSAIEWCLILIMIFRFFQIKPDPSPTFISSVTTAL